MADQAINALSTKTAPETSDQLLLVGAGEPQLIDYDKLADAILNKITSKNYALDAGQMTLLAALNKLNSETKKYISKAEHIKTENNRSQYRIAPIVSDTGALCINRAGLYLIKLGQTGGVFNSASIKKIYEEGNDAKIQIDKDGKAIIFECDIYSNPIFIGVFK